MLYLFKKKALLCLSFLIELTMQCKFNEMQCNINAMQYI